MMSFFRKPTPDQQRIQELEAELEAARRDHTEALLLIAHIRTALGDNGKLMPDELIAYCKELRSKSAKRKTKVRK